MLAGYKQAKWQWKRKILTTDTSSWTWDCRQDCFGQLVTSELPRPNRRVCTSRGGETVGFSADQVEDVERSFSSSEYKLGSAASISTDLTREQDAAHSYMGGKWRMPTKAEFEELFSNTTQTWTLDYNGTAVVGHIFVSKSNGNSMFFPAAGYRCNSPLYKADLYGRYWTASWESKHCALYSCLAMCKVSYSRFGNYGVLPNYRDRGLPVRGVRGWISGCRLARFSYHI